MLLFDALEHADNCRKLETNRLLVELICRDIEGVWLKHVTGYFFLQLVLYTVSILKGNDKSVISDVSGTLKVRASFIVLMFEVLLRD